MAYSPTYGSEDFSTSIIDFIVTIIVNMVGEADTIGIAIALTIAVGLLIGLLIMLFRALGTLVKTGKKLN